MFSLPLFGDSLWVIQAFWLGNDKGKDNSFPCPAISDSRERCSSPFLSWGGAVLSKKAEFPNFSGLAALAGVEGGKKGWFGAGECMHEHVHAHQHPLLVQVGPQAPVMFAVTITRVGPQITATANYCNSDACTSGAVCTHAHIHTSASHSCGSLANRLVVSRGPQVGDPWSKDTSVVMWPI